MKILQKGRILECRIRASLKNKKQLSNQYYRLFLQRKSINLPKYNTLKKWRNRLIITSLFCLLFPSLQIIYDYDIVYKIVDEDENSYNTKDLANGLSDIFYHNLSTVFGLVFIILFCFAGTFDYTIYKRWGNKYSILKW